MGQDLEGLVSNLRAVIQTERHGMKIEKLIEEYNTLIGGQIPYRSFNYNTLESFLRSLPSIHVFGSGKDANVQAVEAAESSHVCSLISHTPQKNSRKNQSARRGGRGSYTPRGGYRGRGNYSNASRPLAGTSAGSSRSAPYSFTSQRNSVLQERLARDNVPQDRLARDNVPQDRNSVPQDNLVIQVGNENRQVSFGGKINNTKKQPTPPNREPKNSFEVPPRFRKKNQVDTESASTSRSSPNDIAEGLEESYIGGPKETNRLPSTSDESGGPKDMIRRARLQQGHQAPIQLYRQALDSALHQNSNDIEPPMGEDDIFDGLELEPTVPLPDTNDPSNNIRILDRYAAAVGWPNPEYKSLPRKSKDYPGKKIYGASVKVHRTGMDLKKYSSFPDEFFSEVEAHGRAAQRALEDLYEEEKVKLEKTIIITDPKLFGDRVTEMVKEASYGIFSSKIQDLYAEKYNERLPDDWLQYLSTCPTVTVETSLNNTIIHYRNPDTILDGVFDDSFFPDVPPLLEPPEEDNWFVYVTHAISPSNVWFLIIGEEYNEKLVELRADMENYYRAQSSNNFVLNIERGKYYAASCISENNEEEWSRIYVCDKNEKDKTVEVLFIDHGSIDVLPFTCVYNLPKQFCALPRQAVECTLEGLEHLNEDIFACEFIADCEDLIARSLVAQINSKNYETGVIKVTLYDTSGDDDININDKIKSSIDYKNAAPVLPNEGCAAEVLISEISKRGEIYIQMPGHSFSQIEQVLVSLEVKDIAKQKLTSFRQIALNKIYLAKHLDHDCWYRAVVTSTPSVQLNKISVRYIDFGYTNTITMGDIADVENLPPIISKYPPQAVKVALRDLPVENFIKSHIMLLHKLLDDNEKIVLMKTIKGSEDPPVVELFSKAKEGDGALVSVNFTLEQAMMNNAENNAGDSKSAINTNGDLNHDKCLPWPNFGDGIIMVTITLAANPGNFIFQLRKYRDDLDNLMESLQCYYDTIQLPELAMKEIEMNKFYAVQYIEDNYWYRCVVIKIFHESNLVSVQLCDLGDVVLTSSSRMRKLESEFCDLPFTAIKGKLAGVEPSHKDWSVEDCVRFQQLVMKKELKAYVVNAQTNNINPMEMTVSLHLVEKIGGEEKAISKILIDENRAVPT